MCKQGGVSVVGAPRTHLEGTVDHADDVVELLMVQYGAVLLDVEAELVGETLACRFTLECAQGGWQRLPRGGRKTSPTSHELSHINPDLADLFQDFEKCNSCAN